MLQPKRIKHRKVHVGRLQAKTSRGFDLSFGSFGLKVLESSFINSKQIESARRTMTRFIQRGGKIWIRIFPDKPITTRPPEVTMGGGKGSVEYYVFPVKPGRILFEVDGVSRDVALEALRLAGYKLPVTTRIVSKEQ